MPEIVADRHQQILDYIYEEGYAQTSNIHQELFSHLSIQTVRRLLRDLVNDQKVGFRELPTLKGQGKGERVYFIGDKGFNPTSQETLSQYKKRRDRIPLHHLRHYLATRAVEKAFLRAATNHYSIKSINEFSDYSDVLQIKLKVKRQTVQIRPDAQIKFEKHGLEHLTLFLEVDMNTESFPVIMRKLDAYQLLFEHDSIEKYANVFPALLVVVATEKRIISLLGKIKKHKIRHQVLFLPHENATSNLLTEQVLLHSQGKKSSIKSVIDQRTTLLQVHHAIHLNAKEQNSYRITCKTKYTDTKDPFFPVFLHGVQGGKLWHPDGYLRIWKNYEEQWNEQLFALILWIEHPKEWKEKVGLAQIFLSDKEHRSAVTQTQCYGIMVITSSEAIFSEAKEIQLDERVRWLVNKNIWDKNLLVNPVWKNFKDVQPIIKNSHVEDTLP